MRKAQLADYVANRRKQKKEQGREGSNFEESGSRGIREEATEIYSDPVHRVGDLVMILKDTRPGVSFKLSYDKEGRVIEAIDGKGSGPNLYVVKLLHEHGTEKVDELWLVPIDYCGSVMSTRRKKGTKRYLDNKNVVISDLMGRNAVLRKKLKDRDIQLEEQRKVKELYEKQNHNIREVCFHAMIDKLDAFLRYYLLLLLSFSHRVLSSYPNFSVVFLFIQRLQKG